MPEETKTSSAAGKRHQWRETDLAREGVLKFWCHDGEGLQNLRVQSPDNNLISNLWLPDVLFCLYWQAWKKPRIHIQTAGYDKRYVQS